MIRLYVSLQRYKDHFDTDDFISVDNVNSTANRLDGSSIPQATAGGNITAINDQRPLVRQNPSGQSNADSSTRLT